MELDLTVNSKRRYANFVKRVSESTVVWGLKVKMAGAYVNRINMNRQSLCFLVG